MYSLSRNYRVVQNRSSMIVKYACHNCQFPKKEFRFNSKHYSSISVLQCRNYSEPVVERKLALLPSCDLLSYRCTNEDGLYYPLYNSLSNDRRLSTSCIMLADPSKPSSKVEETVTALKEKAKEKEDDKKAMVVKKSVKQKIVDELQHYYHGFRLLFIDINVSSKLLFRVLRGNKLTRREHNLLVRTVSDLFRLVPFSVFIIVPFMEFLLPVFIKFFPGMLPSTFQTTKDKDDKMKQSLKVKLEMAKFLQETLDSMSLKGIGHSSVAAKEFAQFCENVRSEGGICSSEEIMKFSKLFEDEITLDSLPRPQLVALCRVLELKPIGTSNFLRFQLRMKLRSLAADDLEIHNEGIDTLSQSELQQACRARGMRAYGLSGDRLKFQLAQWLDLSLNQKVPPSLLLLSRAFMLPETIPTTDKLKATISALPETVAVSTKAAIGEREGKVDNKTKIEIIKEEQRKIQEERKEVAEEMRLASDSKLKHDAEILVDKASVLIDNAVDMDHKELHATAEKTKRSVASIKKKLEAEEVTSDDIETLQEAIELLANEKKSLQIEKEELDELREEISEYKEDVDDLKEVMETSEDAAATQIKESKGAQRLYKKVSSMIAGLDEVVGKLEKKEEDIKKSMKDDKPAENAELLRIDELMSVIRKIQKIPDQGKLEKIADVLSKIDEDHDGSIRIDTVLKVMEEIDEGNVKLSSSQFDDLVQLLEKEEAFDAQKEKAAENEKNKSASGIDKSSKKLNITSKLPETATPIPPTKDVGKSNTKPKSL